MSIGFNNSQMSPSRQASINPNPPLKRTKAIRNLKKYRLDCYELDWRLSKLRKPDSTKKTKKTEPVSLTRELDDFVFQIRLENLSRNTKEETTKSYAHRINFGLERLETRLEILKRTPKKNLRKAEQRITKLLNILSDNLNSNKPESLIKRSKKLKMAKILQKRLTKIRTYLLGGRIKALENPTTIKNLENNTKMLKYELSLQKLIEQMKKLRK